MKKKSRAVAVIKKDMDAIKKEWDCIASVRLQQITSGEDISYRYVLLPTIKDLVCDSTNSEIIDLGCGCGDLSAEIAKISKSVVAVDFSNSCIRIANKEYGKITNLRFEVSSIEELPHKYKHGKFDIAIANMTLMTTMNLIQVLQSVNQLLKPGGVFINTITHPAYWPIYWGYFTEEWFDYNSEIIIEAPFRISKEETNLITTHIHRPLHYYINNFRNQGFTIDKVVEPYPPENIISLYPDRWEYPRFMGFRLLSNVN
jgi:ubiquinone/menaquinone biosynthesis C-methylase UbiE